MTDGVNNTDAVQVALALGGNVGDVPRTFDKSIGKLAAAGLEDIRRSSLYRNPAVGCAPGTPDFINAVVTGLWRGSPQGLKTVCQRIEVEAGRPREHPRWSSRSLDIDIILYGRAIISDHDLSVPHPAAMSRLFVLLPLSEIAGEWGFPGVGMTVKELLEERFGLERSGFETLPWEFCG